MTKEPRQARQGRGRAARPDAPGQRQRRVLLPVDAEDIAMARLQAQLRQTETVQASRRNATRSPSRRATVQLPLQLLGQARDRAKRDALTLSEVVQAALERYLKPR